MGSAAEHPAYVGHGASRSSDRLQCGLVVQMAPGVCAWPQVLTTGLEQSCHLCSSAGSAQSLGPLGAGALLCAWCDLHPLRTGRGDT